MSNEDKDLLLKDLCARLSYNTVLSYAVNDSILGIHWNKIPLSIYILHGIEEEDAWDCVKPYLRPMSSMTDEEMVEYSNIDNGAYSCPKDYAHVPAKDRIDWLNKNHFDYRGLIPKGLAIDCTNLNIY
jgi:hypothetical protein